MCSISTTAGRKYSLHPTCIICVLSKQLQEVNIHCTPCNSRFFKDKKEKALCFIHLWPLRSILHEKGSLHCLQFSPKWETDPTLIRCVLSKQLQEVNIYCTPCNSRFSKTRKKKRYVSFNRGPSDQSCIARTVYIVRTSWSSDTLLTKYLPS